VIARADTTLEALGIPLGAGTNNEGELMAAVAGLSAAIGAYADPGEQLILVSDSKYLLNGLSNIAHYTSKPTRPNWRMWLMLSDVLKDAGLRNMSVKTFWVRGHDRNTGNIMCDRLAQRAARTQEYQTIDGIQPEKYKAGMPVRQAGKSPRRG
jgi:ribonuclease HI